MIMVVLTEREEKNLLSEYSKIAWKLVHRFADGRASSIFTQEDLYQECMLVLVKHMRKCETKQQLKNIQAMDLVNAMTRFVLKNQAVRLDCNRTNEVKRIIETCARKTCLSEAEALPYDGLSSIEAVIEKVAFEQFLDKTSVRPVEAEAMTKRMEGHTVCEIAEMTGRSHQVISYALKTGKRKYDEFVVA